MHRHGSGSAIRMFQENMTAPSAVYGKADLLKGTDDVLSRRGEDESYGDLLDANKFEGAWVAILFFQAKLDHFAGALHQSVEVFGLSVAAVKGRNGGDVIAFLVLLDQHCEFPLLLHASGLFAKVYHERPLV